MGHPGCLQGGSACTVIAAFLFFLYAKATILPLTDLKGRVASSAPPHTLASFPSLNAGSSPDEGCLGYSAAECPKSRPLSTALGNCICVNSRVQSECSWDSVHGWTGNGTGATFQRFAGYHENNYRTRCGREGCSAAYGVRGLMSSSQAECQCTGHFASLEDRCVTCANGWYGDECDLPCLCNGHGRCGRYNGTCTCYADAERGYWQGSDCAECSPAFMGARCTNANTLFTELRSAEFDVRLSYAGNAKADEAEESTISVEWSPGGQLVLGKGNTIVCGTVDITASGDTQSGETVAFGSAAVFQHAPYPVREMRLLRNGTVVVLTAGTNAGTPSDSTLRVIVWHVSPLPEDGECVFARVQDTALDYRVMGTIVDAHISETHGWALLLSSGAVVLENRLGEVLTLPSQFIGKSLQIDDVTGMVLLAGVRSLDWGLYATHTTDSSAPFYAVSIVAATAARNPAGIAWRVSTVGDRVRVLGTAQGVVWVATGRLTHSDASIGEATGTTFSLETSSEVSVAGNVRALSLSTLSDQAASTLFVFVQTEASLWTVTWLNEHASDYFRKTASESLSVSSPLSSATNSADPRLTLRNLQMITNTANTSLFPARMVTVSNGLLLLCQPFSSSAGEGVHIRPFTGYGVTSLSPSTADTAGGTQVTVRGIGLRDGMNCIFNSATRVVSTLINSTAVRCVAPPHLGSFVCASCSVEVEASGFPFNVTTQSGVTLHRLSTPRVSSAFGQDTTGPYAFVTSTAPVLVLGQWFLNTTELRCRFEDEVSRYETQGHYITSRQVACDPPKHNYQPTKGSTGTVAVSLDGRVFSAPLAFTFIGVASRLAVATPSSATIEVRSAAFVELPPIVLQVVDAEGHPLRELDGRGASPRQHSRSSNDEGRVVVLNAPWLHSTRKEVKNPLDPFRSLVVLAFSNKTVNGAASFSVYLQYPLASVGALEFTTEGLGSVQLLYSVIVGDPQSIVIAVQPAPLLSSRYVKVSRQPIVVFKDAAGNTVSDRAVIQANTGGYVRAVYFNGSDTVECLSEPVAESGLLSFSGLEPLGLFGQAYTVIFSAEKYTSVSSNPMAMADCRPDEYGQYNTTLCLPCLPHTSCNGSYVVNVTDGYWKGGTLVYGVYACPQPRVCRSGGCATGYTGVLCSVCSGGYGLTGSQCVQCFSTAVNITLTALLSIFVLICVLWLTFVAFQVLGPRCSVAHCVRAALNFAQLVSLVILPLPELPEYVQQFTVLTRLLSMGDVLRLSPFSCLFKLDATSRFVFELVAVVVVSLLLQVTSMCANVLFERHWARLQKRQSFLRLFAPFTSEEAYYNRLAELGLDEEHALAQVAVTETLDPRQRRLRDAYALLDKNRYAITAVGQLPHSVVREAAMRSLLGERAELQHFLDKFETYVSCSDGLSTLTQTASNTSTTGAASLPPQPSADNHLNGVDVRRSTANDKTGDKTDRIPGEGGIATSVRAGAITPKEKRASLDRPQSPPQGQQQGRHGSDDDGDGGVGVGRVLSLAVGWKRFDGITAMPFNLFGTQELFKPTPTLLHPRILPQLAPMKGEEHVAPLRYTRDTSPSFLWPPLKAQIVTCTLTVYHYFYVAVLEYSFALMRCDEIVSAAVGENSSASAPAIPPSFSYVSLVSDRSVECNRNTYSAYRFWALLLGSGFAAAGPLLLVCFSVWQPSTAHGGLPGYTRECCLTLYALRGDYLWWEAFLLACKLLLVMYRTLIPHIHLTGLLTFWTISAVLGLTVYLQPFYDYLSQSLHAITFLILSFVAAFQLLPAFYYTSAMRETSESPIELSAIQHASGVLVAFLSCCAFAVMMPVVWTAMLPRNRCQLFDAALYHLGSGAESADNGASGQTTAARRLSTASSPLSFARYNIKLVQQALRGAATAESDKDECDKVDLEVQIVQAVRGKASTKTGRRSSSLWVDWGMVGGVVGMANHEHLFFRFIDKNEVRSQTDVVPAAKSMTPDTTPEATAQSPLHILEEEVADELASLSEHLRQLERFVQLMEKAVERRTTSG